MNDLRGGMSFVNNININLACKLSRYLVVFCSQLQVKRF